MLYEAFAWSDCVKLFFEAWVMATKKKCSLTSAPRISKLIKLIERNRFTPGRVWLNFTSGFTTPFSVEKKVETLFADDFDRDKVPGHESCCRDSENLEFHAELLIKRLSRARRAVKRTSNARASSINIYLTRREEAKETQYAAKARASAFTESNHVWLRRSYILKRGFYESVAEESAH